MVKGGEMEKMVPVVFGPGEEDTGPPRPALVDP